MAGLGSIYARGWRRAQNGHQAQAVYVIEEWCGAASRIRTSWGASCKRATRRPSGGSWWREGRRQWYRNEDFAFGDRQGGRDTGGRKGESTPRRVYIMAAGEGSKKLQEQDGLAKAD